MAELAPGSQSGSYRIDGIAGQGGMGVVYRATQLGLDRSVALKVIAPAFAHDPEFRERFKRESKLAASIEHPNVIPVYEAGAGPRWSPSASVAPRSLAFGARQL